MVTYTNASDAEMETWANETSNLVFMYVESPITSKEFKIIDIHIVVTRVTLCSHISPKAPTPHWKTELS